MVCFVCVCGRMIMFDRFEIRYLVICFGMDWKSLPQNQIKNQGNSLTGHIWWCIYVVFCHKQKRNIILTHYFVFFFGAINFKNETHAVHFCFVVLNIRKQNEICFSNNVCTFYKEYRSVVLFFCWYVTSATGLMWSALKHIVELIPFQKYNWSNIWSHINQIFFLYNTHSEFKIDRKKWRYENCQSECQSLPEQFQFLFWLFFFYSILLRIWMKLWKMFDKIQYSRLIGLWQLTILC